MKTKMLSIVILLLAAMSAQGELKMVTTATDYADIARQIGGDKVSVHSVMKGPENVHNVMARPSEMVHLNQADLFVHGGLDTEPWRDNLLKGARNPRVMINHPGNVDMSVGIELKEIPAGGRGDRSQGDMHAYGNPHYSSDPRNAQTMAATLCAALVRNDPANADFYKANAIKFVKDIDALMKELQAKFKPYDGLKVMTYHKAWEYFADAFAIDIVGTIEAKIGITPSPAEMQKTIQLMKDQGVKVVIVETYNSYDNAKFVADAAGAKVVVLPDHVLGVPRADTYQNLFRYNIDKLIDTAQAAGVEPRK